MPNELSIGDLLKEISSDSPAPGGGSVAALSGSFGGALVSMVCRLSIGKKKYKEAEDELKGVLNEAELLRKELFDLSNKDVDAFKEVMTALKTPEGEENRENIQNAYKNATNVPFEVATKCLRIMKLAEITTLKGNKNAITDSGVAALMANSGLKGAVLNVMVNLKYIEDEKFKTEKVDGIENLEKRAERILNTLMEKVESSL